MDDKAAKQLERLKELGDEPDAVWPPDAAAMFLSVSVSVLSKWRRRGGKTGPDYVRLSKTRVGYRKAALVDWLRGREYQSTSAESAGVALAAPSPEAAK